MIHASGILAATGPSDPSDLSGGPILDHLQAADAAAGSDMLLIACLVMLVIASIAVANVTVARRELRKSSRVARLRAASLHEFIQTIRMVETIAGIGLWQFDPKTGQQTWSSGLKELFGVDEEENFVDGDAETLLAASNIDLITPIKDRAFESDPFTLQFDIRDYEDRRRVISVHACNIKDRFGAVQRVVAVVRDVTTETEHVRKLEYSHAQAIDEAERARRLAETDPLTGLANRRRVMAALDKFVMDARVTSMPLVLVMFDIDYFKSVNDRFGHPHGDEVIKRVAELTKMQARDSDLVGRVGGEEFVWIIPGASDGMAEALTERLRKAVEEGSSVGQGEPVTISVGYTSGQLGGTGLTLFARADAALYEAKHSGRNQVQMAA